MNVVAGILGLMLLYGVLEEVFVVIVRPRRVSRRFRFVLAIYSSLWPLFKRVARRMRDMGRREDFLSIYGPLGMLFILGTWVVLLVTSFALLQWAFGSGLSAPERTSTFGTDLYLSGTTLFTLGLGDVFPHTTAARVLTVLEAGTGLGILAIVIGYLPVLYQTFSERERNLLRLEARAGSPPCAVELFRRYGRRRNKGELNQFLYDWEGWLIQLLESHVSSPYMAYFRAQHEGLSWVTALTVI